MGFETQVDAKAREVIDDLCTRATKMERRIASLGLGGEGVSWPEGTAVDTAKYYAKEIGLGNPEVAREAFETLTDEAEWRTPEFWGSPLGRVFFMFGLYPSTEMERPMAVALLGTSRQRVYQLVKDGTLPMTMGQGVRVDDVMTLMRRV